MEINDWSDIGKLDNMSTQQKEDDDLLILDPGEEEELRALSNNDNNEMDAMNNQDDNRQTNDKKNDNVNQDYQAVSDWNDMRIYDDDHDDDWFKVQEKKLAKQYGGNFIRVKYADHGRVVYFCELCIAECNAKKSLELHCGGMKHLKKKDLWEKEGKPTPQIGFKTKAEPAQSSKEQSWNDRNKSRDRRNSREPPSRSRKRSRSRERRREQRSIASRLGLGRSRSPLRNEPSWGLDRDRDLGFRRGAPLSTVGNNWGGPLSGMRSNFGDYQSFSPPPARLSNFFANDQFPPRGGFSRSRLDRVSPQRRLGPFGDRYEDTPIPPSPPRFGSPDRDGRANKSGLSSSPAGVLLQKLAECCVKSADDAELAINVVASLCKSLKEYSQNIGENKIAELLMDAELKVGTVKALKVGMKILNSFGDPKSGNTGSDFMDTLTLSHHERNKSLSSAMPLPLSHHERNKPLPSAMPSMGSQALKERPVTYPSNPYLGRNTNMNPQGGPGPGFQPFRNSFGGLMR